MKFKHILFSTLLVFGLNSCAEDSFTSLTDTIFDGVAEDPELSTLEAAIQKSGVIAQLSGTQYTLFAPTDQAFIDAGININNIDAATLAEIIKYHMIPTRVDASRLDVEYGKFFGLITPSSDNTLNFIGNLTYLGVQTLNLSVNANIYYTQAIQVLDNSTSDLALEGFYVNGARVVEADAFEGGNGVVHKIDKVLLPPSGSAAATIENDPDLSLFNKLVKKASVNANGIPSYALSVLDVLPANALATTRAGTLTVFAPTNQAMIDEGLNEAAIDALTVAQCLGFARQHVVNLRWFSSDLSNQLIRNSPFLTSYNLVTQQTPTFNLTYNNNAGTVNFSTLNAPTIGLVEANIVTTNGVIHKVNRFIE
ncbi:MAG: fasciclin domain-containing protein [Cyclobacteriaceae bacterium]|nr:fasciclin domain-containing protein [Cyclobacteriaceae bacterium]